MIRKVELFSIVCDRCGETFLDEFSGFSAFADEVCAREEANGSGWIEIGNKNYCPNCYQYNSEADEYEPKKK